jgi:hypothetical protein
MLLKVNKAALDRLEAEIERLDKLHAETGYVQLLQVHDEIEFIPTQFYYTTPCPAAKQEESDEPTYKRVGCFLVRR